MTDIRKRERPTTAAGGIMLHLLLLLFMAIAPYVVQADFRASKAGGGTSSSTAATIAAVTTVTSAAGAKASKTTATTSVPATPGATTATTAVPLAEVYFYPETFEGNTFCVLGAKTSIKALANMTPEQQDSFLSSSMCECCRKHKCAIDMSGACGTTAATTAATTATAAVTTTPALDYRYYSMPTTPAVPTENRRYYSLRGGDVVICVATTATPYPANVELFSDICECCKKVGCVLTMGLVDHCTTTTTATTTAARDAECQTEPFSVKVGTGCKEFFFCEGGRIIEKMVCPAGFFFNGRHCDLASNVDCEPDPDCQEKSDSISVKVGTGCKDYVFCENGLLLGTVTCPDGLVFNGTYCDSAEKVDCASNIQ